MLYSAVGAQTSDKAFSLIDESQAVDGILKTCTTTQPSAPAVSRIDLAFAFDPISVSEPSLAPVSYLDPSVFDRTLRLITLDVAPYVRGIVAYDSRLQKQRLKMSSLISEGGQPARTKRMRTTRAALSALEGGSRSTTRAERWFKADVNPYLVMRTGGDGWHSLVALGESGSPQSSPKSSPTKTPSPAPVKRERKPKKNIVVDDDESPDELG
jgi:hypothetical protein